MNIPILSIRGLASAGKTFCADYVRSTYPKVEIIPFAQILKQEVFEMLWTLAHTTCDIHFTTYYPQVFDVPKPPVDADAMRWIAAHKVELRGVLQKWGDYKRAGHVDYFVKRWSRLYQAASLKKTLLVIVDDCRYPNEYGMLAGLGAMQYYVHNPHIAQMDHASELMNAAPMGGDSFIDNDPKRDATRTYQQLDTLLLRDFPHLNIKQVA